MEYVLCTKYFGWFSFQIIFINVEASYQEKSKDKTGFTTSFQYDFILVRIRSICCGGRSGLADSIAAKLLKSLGFPRKPKAKNLWIRGLLLKVPAFVFGQIGRQGWFRTTFHATFMFNTVQEKVESIAGYTVWTVNDVWAMKW